MTHCKNTGTSKPECSCRSCLTEQMLTHAPQDWLKKQGLAK